MSDSIRCCMCGHAGHFDDGTGAYYCQNCYDARYQRRQPMARPTSARTVEIVKNPTMEGMAELLGYAPPKPARGNTGATGTPGIYPPRGIEHETQHAADRLEELLKLRELNESTDADRFE